MNVKMSCLSILLSAVGGVWAGEPCDVFIGTQGMGNVTPAAVVPFGMLQPGPDTSPYEDGFKRDSPHNSGYQHDDKYLWRFSQTHLSGMGCPGGGNVAILPMYGMEPPVNVVMDKATESARPGYYAVTLADGIRCEMTADEHIALYRFGFPAGRKARLLLDLDFVIMGRMKKDDPFGSRIFGTACTFESPTSACGYQYVRNFVEYGVWFATSFSAPVVDRKRLQAPDGWNGEIWALDFGEIPGGVLEVRMALSYSSTDGAKRNLAAETKSFDATLACAERRWNDFFARVELDPSTPREIQRSFASALFHLAFQPNLASDVGEEERYVTFSLWDTFRAAHPLYTILAPERVDAFVRSLLGEYDSRGFLPILSVYGRDTHCMIGHHSAPVIADAYLKGFRGFDAKKALEAMRASYSREHVPESMSCWGFMKEDWHLLDDYGYYPFDKLKTSFRKDELRGESVSRTLECAYDDACVARYAAALGDDGMATYFRNRSGCWSNVFDRTVGFARGKDSKGRWREPFDPAKIGFGPWAERDFTEGNSYQYSWHVMHDPEGLVTALGGPQAAGEKLDELFSAKVGYGVDDRSYDVIGLVGQYAHGNEVSHHIAYFYAYTDRPWRTGDIVRKVFDTQYGDRPDGLCGNDDCGQMSAWYVFSALGFYPFDPCGGDYVLGAPQVPGATIRLPGGKRFRVRAENYARDHIRAASASLDGCPLPGHILRHADVVGGGELVFSMKGMDWRGGVK